MAFKKRIDILTPLALLVLATQAFGSGQVAATKKQDSQQAGAGPFRIPNRPSAPLFKGKQGKQKTEIHFDPATRTVTLKLVVQDPNGYFIPNIRRENFVVYENGVRQQDVAVDVEHAPASLALVLEYGGRAQAINRVLGEEIARAGHQISDALGRDDKISIWKYNDKIAKLADFSQGREALDTLFLNLGTPELTETNLYDAVVFMVQQMRPVNGRKGIILISSGIDTFSKAKYEDALNAARDSDATIYSLGMVRVLRQLLEVHGTPGAMAKIDWARVAKELEEIARASGGRAYSPENTIDLSPIYDDIMENLKVRYVITYRSSNDADLNTPRTVRVELVDPKTGGPLQIVDANGRTIPANVIVQESYVPSAAAGQ